MIYANISLKTFDSAQYLQKNILDFFLRGLGTTHTLQIIAE